jgi:hypothetical protein
MNNLLVCLYADGPIFAGPVPVWDTQETEFGWVIRRLRDDTDKRVKELILSDGPGDRKPRTYIRSKLIAAIDSEAAMRQILDRHRRGSPGSGTTTDE